MFAALIILSLVFLVRLLAPQTIGETARRRFLSQLREHYPEHTISLRRGVFDSSNGLTFEGLSISQPREGMMTRGREMVHIDRITIKGSFDPQRMMEKRNPIQTNRIIIDGVRVNAWMDEQGEWAIASLAPLPTFGPAAPRMDLRNITLRLLGASSESQRTRPIELDVDQAVVLCQQGSHGPGRGVDREITLQGSGDYLGKLVAKIVMKGDQLDVRLSGERLRIDRTLLDRIPRRWASQVQDLKNLDCIFDAKIAFAQHANGKRMYRVEVGLHEGQFSHEKLPYPLTNIRGRFLCDPSGVRIEASQASWGDALIKANGKLHGFSLSADAELNLSTRGLLLDDRLAASLPPTMQAGWNKIHPLGRINLDAHIRSVGGTVSTSAEIECKGVDVRYEKFPFPVKQVVGQIKLEHGILTAESLAGRVGGNRMECAFRLPIRPEITHEKSFVIATDGPIAIDNSLMSSLTPRGEPATGLEKFVRGLAPSGSVRLASAHFTTDSQNNKTRQIDLRVVNGSIRYDKFAYPLHNVNGTIRVQDDWLRLEGFRATNVNSGVISCDGTYRLPPPSRSSNQPHRLDVSHQDPGLKLQFRCADMPMDESLRQSLPESTRQVWDSISPSGILDQMEVTVIKQGNASPLSLNVTARQLGHGQVTNRILSVRPASLPYRIDVTGGEVHFDGSQVRISAIRGSHDASKLSADGTCVKDASGRWILTLDLHGGSRLHPDAELIASLPDQMQEAMRTLQLRGPVNIRGRTQVALSNEDFPHPEIDWNLVLQLEGNRIGDVGPVHSIRGEVAVRGHRDHQMMRAKGGVQIDSMHIFDLQVTNMKGPFIIVDDQLRLGDLSSNTKIRGGIFGGNLDLDGEVILSTGNFDVSMTMDGGEVPTLLSEFGQSGEEITGNFEGQVSLEGSLGRIDLLKGNGAVRVTGANLYELPYLVQVLNLLRVTPSEDHAFTDAEAGFSLFGEAVAFSDVQIWGDLVSLHGGGTLSRRRELDLTFNTQVSPKNTFTRFFRPLKDQRYTLWTIDVRGPLADPQIERTALEGVSETLGKWFPGRSKEKAARGETSQSTQAHPRRSAGRMPRNPVLNRF